MKYFLLLFLFLSQTLLWAGENFITTLPKTYGQFLDSSFSRSAVPGWGKVALATGTLLILDQQILKQVQKAGRGLGWGNNDESKKRIFIGDESLMNAPTNLPSTIFFLGDGWFTLGIAGGFFSTGLIVDNERARETSAQLIQGLFMTGLTTNVLKRITGREEPKTRSSSHGKWHPFPNQNEFADHKTKYDAFPSAHTATFLTTVNIIAENYSDYTFIRPAGYTLMGLLAFQMINQGAHWASDIPLSIGMSHLITKAILNNSKKVSLNEKSDAAKLYFYPRINSEGFMSAHMEYLF